MIMVDIWGIKVNGYGYNDLRWDWFGEACFKALVIEVYGIIYFWLLHTFITYMIVLILIMWSRWTRWSCAVHA